MRVPAIISGNTNDRRSYLITTAHDTTFRQSLNAKKTQADIPQNREIVVHTSPQHIFPKNPGLIPPSAQVNLVLVTTSTNSKSTNSNKTNKLS